MSLVSATEGVNGRERVKRDVALLRGFSFFSFSLSSCTFVPRSSSFCLPVKTELVDNAELAVGVRNLALEPGRDRPPILDPKRGALGEGSLPKLTAEVGVLAPLELFGITALAIAPNVLDMALRLPGG